jgi:LacI family transcriptional regulator
MRPHPPELTTPQPTLRELAELAGVSQMTVSRAMAGRGRIAAATRRRILDLAGRHGYRPDPEISKLMHHLRNRRTRRFQSMIFGLTTRSADDPEPYSRNLREGAARQLAERGYGFELLHLERDGTRPAGLQRMLHSRGVEGLMLLPQQAPVDLSDLLEWNRFAVVSASASATVPGAHRVIPHHFANMLLLCRTLAGQGHRRIGLVLDAAHDRRTEHGFTAGVTWHGLNEARHFVPPFLRRNQTSSGLRTWFAREKPDVIITSEFGTAELAATQLGRALKGSLRFVIASRMPRDDGNLPGIDERPELIGHAAADLLAGLVEKRNRSRPDASHTTLLTGRWVE